MAWKIVGLLLLIAVGVGAFVYQFQQANKKPLAQPMEMGKMGAMGPGMRGMAKMPGTDAEAAAEAAETLGNEEAKVLVEASVPLGGVECHAKTVKMLRALAQAEPERVCVKLINHFGPEGQQLTQERGTGCASVFVNGEYEFDLADKEGQTRSVEFLHRPNDPGADYRSEDVIDAVNMKLIEEYGQGLKEETLAKIKSAGEEAATS